MQEIEDENSTIGESQRLHALNDDDDLCFGVQSLLKSSTSMDAVISLPSVVTDIAAFTANSLKELQMKENGQREVDGGRLDTLMGVSLKLLSKKYPSEIQWHGVKILLHLLRFWWNEFSITECGNRVVGSKRTVATLVAEVAWRHGISELHDLIPHLVSLSAKGACEAELVCFILGSMSNVGITCDALFEGGRSEMFLHGLGEFLPQILPLLCSLLDKHARDYFTEMSNQHMEVANQHECTVKAALDAAHAYAEWTPVTDLTKYGLIERCGSLLCSNIFRTQALQFFKSMLQSKRPVGLAVAEYDVTVSNVFPILISISEDPLKFIEPERQCWKALYPSLGYHTVHAKALYKHLESLESIPATPEYPSKSDDGLLPCSSLVPVSPEVDNISCPSDMEDIIEGYHLVEEHNMLSEAFICVASCPRVENNTELLSCILFPLSKIWNQPEWEISLMHYFGDNRFRTSVHSIAVFFEKELQKCMSQKSNGIGKMGNPSYASLTTLLPLILPQLLKLLQYVHSLWTDEVASDLSEEIEEAKFVMCSGDSSSLENEIRVWLQNIRETGYMVIGSCSYLEGAFDNVLDSTFVCGALMKNLESMEFRHLTWFIKYTIIPLVKNCPSGLWPTWIDMLLKPVFHYCDYTLYSSWCHLLYKNTVQVPDNFGDISISKEEADELGMDLIFKLTREVSNLLAAMALPKLNGGIAHEHTSTMHKATSEDLESVFSTSLVGYLLYNDDLSDSILRFIAYIFGYWTDGVARITAASFCHNLIRVATVMHSDKLISFVKDDIIPNVIRCLALEPGLDRDSESNHMRCDTDSGSDNKSARSGSDILTDLCYDACRCTQDQGLLEEGTCDVSNAETFRKWLSNEVEAARCKNKSVDELEETSDEPEELPWIWEIEEEFIGYLPTYTGILHGLDVYVDNIKPFQADSVDFLEHLQPFAQNYINKMNSAFNYYEAKEQAKLHLEFDTELASGTLDEYVRKVRSSKGGFLNNTLDNDIIGGHFQNLDCKLREKSLERRDQLFEEEDRLCLYVKHMENIIGNEQLINRLQSLIDELDAEHFFLVDDDIEWGKKRFSDLIDKFEEDVFAGLHLPKCYVIRGIMDLRQMLCMKDRTLIDAFTAVVGGQSERWMKSRDLFWMDTRYYEHDHYSVIKDPLRKIWMKKHGQQIQHGTGNE
ncbi:protein HASTY 1 isoform X2 [Sorghum bicolor]|uniref:Uncharacterized protein n=1 Tax=Sorghum bicolor TaxID=4558 RepID=A0A1W0W0M9_SORBI|nr:protein HASTY 1 isoform X2 [Sorghum bicolor]OQU87915.1 hypothetical protein SORBI_3003G366850 [Sorghum bicolor]|eukprot:XP_021312472.1 protein HASTY 1 isoform X2 [Sorghum bicolor]